MPRRMRTFIAVAVGQFSRDRLAGLRDRLADVSRAVKWVEPDNWHVTLLFLGEIDERDVLPVCRTVEAVSKGFAPFAMTLAGTGAFPTPRRPRTLIAHVTEGAEELVALHAALEGPLMELGCYRREERAYRPHLTLGRVRAADDPAALAAAVQQFAKWQGGQTQVGEVLVLSSELRPQGPEYAVLCRAPLRGKSQPG